MLRTFIISVLAMALAIGFAHSFEQMQPVPPDPLMIAASRVTCPSDDFDPVDTQPAVQNCHQRWFDTSNGCYYNAVIDRSVTPWQVRAMVVILRPYTNAPWCEQPVVGNKR